MALIFFNLKNIDKTILGDRRGIGKAQERDLKKKTLLYK